MKLEKKEYNIFIYNGNESGHIQLIMNLSTFDLDTIKHKIGKDFIISSDDYEITNKMDDDYFEINLNSFSHMYIKEK